MNTKLDIYAINTTIKYECNCQRLKGNTCTKMFRSCVNTNEYLKFFNIILSGYLLLYHKPLQNLVAFNNFLMYLLLLWLMEILTRGFL